MSKEADSIFWEYLNNFFQKKKDSSKSTVQFLKSLPFFQNLKKSQIYDLSLILHKRSYEVNECLFEIGQPGAALFIIEQGEVLIEAPRDNGMAQLAVIKDHSILGELALLDHSPRSATARASQEVVAYCLFRSELEKLSVRRPDITSEIYKVLATMTGERLKKTNSLLKIAQSHREAA